MNRKKTEIITIFIICLLLSACSIGKKQQQEPDKTNLTIESEKNEVRDDENKNNIEETVDNDFKESVEPKEDRLVLPEVEVEGYGDTKSGE